MQKMDKMQSMVFVRGCTQGTIGLTGQPNPQRKKPQTLSRSNYWVPHTRAPNNARTFALENVRQRHSHVLKLDLGVAVVRMMESAVQSQSHEEEWCNCVAQRIR